MSEETHEESVTPDPLVVAVKRAAVHLGKAGFELAAAVGALSSGVSRKIRPQDSDDESGTGPHRVTVD
jgi:hypothetical protein